MCPEQMYQVSEAFGSRQAVLDGKERPGDEVGIRGIRMGWSGRMHIVRSDGDSADGSRDLLWIGHNFEDMTGLEDREQ